MALLELVDYYRRNSPINSLVKLYFRTIPTILCDGASSVSTEVLLRSLAAHQF